MSETDTNLRMSTFDTLAFLASPERQREFASRTYYADYVAEFSSWWFDSFMPDSAFTAERFSPGQLSVLRGFSSQFTDLLGHLGNEPRTIDVLLGHPSWDQVIAKA